MSFPPPVLIVIFEETAEVSTVAIALPKSVASIVLSPPAIAFAPTVISCARFSVNLIVSTPVEVVAKSASKILSAPVAVPLSWSTFAPVPSLRISADVRCVPFIVIVSIPTPPVISKATFVVIVLALNVNVLSDATIAASIILIPLSKNSFPATKE